MPAVTYILPNTDSELRLTLTDSDAVPITSGTVVATIRNPSGTTLATGVALTHAGSGVWKLNIAAAWSFSASVYTVGEFTAVITATYSGKTLTKRVRWPVAWDDTE